MGLLKEYKRTEYCFTSPKIKNEIKLLLLTDSHGKVFGENNEAFVRDLKKEEPDVILVAGDMILAKKKYYEESRSAAFRMLAFLNRICPVFYGNGNHETKVKEQTDIYRNAGEMYEIMMGDKLKILSNESTKLLVKGNEIVISGLEISRSYYKKWGKLSMDVSYLEELLGEGEREEFHILIAHNPHYFDTYAEWGADLSVSGHLHGGVVGWPGCGGVISPQFKLFPKYTAGLFEKSGKKLVVSRGLGEHLPPIRIFNPREYVVIRICPEKISP